MVENLLLSQQGLSLLFVFSALTYAGLVVLGSIDSMIFEIAGIIYLASLLAMIYHSGKVG
jgi:hypothetical protein